VSFVISAISLLLIRSPEPPRPPRTSSMAIGHEIVEGLQLVRRHRILFPIALRSVIGHVAGSFYGVLYTLFLVDELHLDPLVFGLVISAGGVGSLFGSLAAARVIRRFGLGRAFVWTALGASAIGVLTPFAQGPLLLATIMVLLPQLLGDGLQTIEGVAELSLVQGQTPDRILGRVNATMEVLSHGVAYPIGALAAAAIAETIGVRGGIAIGWAVMALSIVPLLVSPLTRVRHATEELTVES
jgi:predicted MFS family arabinose efflux permease